MIKIILPTNQEFEIPEPPPREIRVTRLENIKVTSYSKNKSIPIQSLPPVDVYELDLSYYRLWKRDGMGRGLTKPECIYAKLIRTITYD